MSMNENLSKLPEVCYSVREYDQSLILLKRGESGFYSTTYSTNKAEENQMLAYQLNAKLGVTKAQEQAMSFGSMFGWEKPGANPDFWVQKAQEADINLSDPDEKAFSLNNGSLFLYIQTCDDGYDYTIYEKDYSEWDGGQLDEPEMSIDEAAAAILESFKLQDLSRDEMDPEQLQESVDEVEQAQMAILLDTTRPLEDRIAEAQKRAEQPVENKNPAKEAERD